MPVVVKHRDNPVQSPAYGALRVTGSDRQARRHGKPKSSSVVTPLTPLCDIPSGCCSVTGPWTVTRSSLRMLRRVAAFCRPLQPVLRLVSFPRSPPLSLAQAIILTSEGGGQRLGGPCFIVLQRGGGSHMVGGW